MMDAVSPKEPHWVLLIDPNSDVQLALTDFLEARGYRVRSAQNGADAIRAMDEGVFFTSALLDLALPDMEGIDLLKKLSRCDPHLPVLVITGQVEIDRELGAFHHGVLAFIRKPYNREQLLALLSRAEEVRNLNFQIVELEQARKDSEERYQLTLDHINDGVCHLDLSGRVNWANQQATILFQRPLNEIIGHSFLKFLSPNAAALAESRLAAIRAGNTVPQIVEFQVVRPDGTEKWIEANVNNVFRQENVIGRLLIGRDITERKQTELDLKERNRFLELDLEVATVIDVNENISNLLQGCTEALVQHLDAAFARIWLLDEAEQLLNLYASAGLYTRIDGTHSQIRVGQYKIGLIAEEGKPILTNTVIGDSHVPEQEWAKREGLVAFAGYPMIRNQKVLGVMALFAKHALTEFTLKSLAMVAQRITVALERQLATDAKNHLLRFNQNLLISAGEGIYGLDRSGNTTFVNPAALQMTGYEKEELLGQSQHAMLHHSRFDGSPYPQEECPIYSAFRDGAVHHINTEVFWRKDGSNFPVQYTSTPTRNQQGELEGAVVTFRDMTQLKQTEAAILQSEKNFRSIYEQAPIGIAVLDSVNGRFKQINKKYCDITGYFQEEMLNLTFQEITYPDDLQANLDHMQQLLAGQISSFQIEKRYIQKNGKVIWVNLTCIPLWLEVTDPPIHMAMVENISQRKQAENGLKESEERFRLLSEAIPQQVWTALSDGSLDYVNQRVVKYFGCSFDEIVGQGWQQFLHPDDLPGCLERWTKARDTQQPYEVEFRLRRSVDHTYRWHIARALPVLNQEGQVVKWFGTNTDITQFKELENQVRQSQKMEAIGTLAGGIAHDFNNILMAITGYAELAKLTVTGNTLAHKNLDEVLVAGQRGKELVQQILAFSRQTEKERQPIELQSVVKEVCKFLRASFPATVEIRQNFTKGTTFIFGDPIQMYQVVMNLCTNAEHAMRERGGLLELMLDHVTCETNWRGTLTQLRAGPYIRLTVRDTGAGITPEVAERIFDPFFTTKKVGEGTGMGLAVVHGIVTSHDGCIDVQSESGQGTTFTIHLPEMEATILKGDIKPIVREFLMGQGHILFVEDEESLARLGEEAMKALGYEVTVHTSSLKALKAFCADPFRFDAVITDQTMPNMTGEVLSRELLKIRPGVPIILCTGYSHSMTSEKANALGIQAFLLKPLLIKDLGRTLREVLNIKND